MNVYVVIELVQECNREKVLDGASVFSTRESALRFLHKRYLDTRLWVDAGAGEMAAGYSDDGWYGMMDMDGDLYEGYLTSVKCFDIIQAQTKGENK